MGPTERARRARWCRLPTGIFHWKTVRASIDYHVEVDRHYYSVPYQLAGQQMEARFTATTVEILHGGKRVASHMRSFAAHRHTTVREHMPKSHQAHLEWPVCSQYPIRS